MNHSGIKGFFAQHKPKGPIPLFLAGCAFGAMVGIIGTVFVGSYNPPDKDDSAAATVVFERIVKQNELVSVSQKYAITDKAKDSNSFFDLFDIPFTENSFWYRYSGVIKAGVNLQTADFKLVGRTIHVTLDEPYVISNTPNMEDSGVLEENNNMLNPIHVQDVDAFQKKCQEDSEKESVTGGLLDEAKANAEANLRCLLTTALGEDYTVEFEYRDGTDEPEVRSQPDDPAAQ